MAFTPCTSITSGLNGTSCTPNPGGVSEIYLTNFDSVTGITYGSTSGGGTGYGIVGLTAGSGAGFFYEYTFRRNTASVVEDLTKDIQTGSLFYSQTITIVLDKIEKAKRDELMLLDNALLMVIAKHSNGTYWLYGLGDGMFVTTDTSGTGTAKTDANGYIVTLLAEEAARAYEVDPAIIPGLLA